MSQSICIKCEVLVSSARYGSECDMDYCGCQSTVDDTFDIERWVQLTRDEYWS